METNAQNATGRSPRVSGSAPRVTYVPAGDATPEGELAALADVYRFLLDSHRPNKVAKTGEDEMGPDREDGREPRHAPAAEGEDGAANLGANDG